MTGKGTVNLSFNHSGKQQQERRRHSFTDSRDYTWDFAHEERFRGRVGGRDAALSGFQPGALPLGWMGQTGSFLGYDASGFLGSMPALAEEPQMSGGNTRRSPKKTSKGTALARKLRGLRGSPEPVSSLESCLRAQLADELVSNRVKAVGRPLNFSSSVAQEFGDEDGDEDEDDEATLIDISASSPSLVGGAVEDIASKPRLNALPKLPNFLKECAPKLSITRKAESGTNGYNPCMKVRADNPAASFSNAGNCPTLPYFETLLFSVGVGLGILFASSQRKTEVKRLSQLLEDTQAELETLKLEPGRRESPSHASGFDSTNESEEQEDQMAELEAELEAELDQLTGGDSATGESQYSAIDEMDMDASVVYGDIAPAGLPAEVEEDTDEDLSPSGRPACSNNYAVSPRELTRLLRKLQTARQDVLINELEEDLAAALSKLQSREKELEVWKDRVRRLTEGSLVPASGSESSSCTPTDGIRLVERYSSTTEDVSEVTGALRSGDPQGNHECSHFPTLENGAPAFGAVSEEDLAGPGSRPRLGPASQGEVQSSLHTESGTQSFKEDERTISAGSELSGDGDSSKSHLQSIIRLEEDVSSQADVSARDCKPILDNSQIITQLIDSVHGLEPCGDRAESVEMGSATPSLGLFSSSVSISDTWDHPLESVTPEGIHGGANRGNSLLRAKLMVPHPSRRTLGNSDLGNRDLNSNLVNENSSSLDANQCTDFVRDSEATEFSKFGSDLSEGETADCRTAETPCSVKYVDSNTEPASEVRVGVGRAGLTTPVENKANQQLLRTSQAVSLKWSGELSPTVLEKIARWEGLMEGETPGPATGSDWECQSRASESEHQQCVPDSENDDANVFSEENLGLEDEEMLGRMLIKRIVEKSRLGSDSLVKKAQSALATLERDDGVEANVYRMEDTYMNDRTDSEVDSSDDNREKQQTGFLDSAVNEEDEFFRRLELISEDRRAVNVVKEKGSKEAANPGGGEFDTISDLNLGSNPPLSPGSRRSGARQAFSKDDGKQPEKERNVKQAAEPDLRGRGNWLSRGFGRQDTSRGKLGYRGEEVRSRRRW